MQLWIAKPDSTIRNGTKSGDKILAVLMDMRLTSTPTVPLITTTM